MALEHYPSQTFHAEQGLESYEIELNTETTYMNEFIALFVGDPIPGMRKVNVLHAELKRVIEWRSTNGMM